MSAPFPKTIALIEALGIDPRYVSAWNIDTTGYDALVPDAGGKRVVNADGTYRVERREWPSLADGIRIVDQLIKEGGYR